MQYTSAQAAKLLRKLNEEKAALLSRESMSCSFVAAVQENVEDVRPEYDYAGTQEKLVEVDEKIRRLKHAMNQFNISTMVPECGMTIDQILVYIPQLTARKQKLEEMASRLPKRRKENYGRVATSNIEYEYANYDPAKVREDLIALSDELAKAQTALDVVNNTATLELPF